MIDALFLSLALTNEFFSVVRSVLDEDKAESENETDYSMRTVDMSRPDWILREKFRKDDASGTWDVKMNI